MGLCPTMAPSTPFVQRPSFACRINQLPARENWPWLGNELVEQLATKDDLEKAVTKIEGTLTLMKWMIGFIPVFVVAIAWRVFV